MTHPMYHVTDVSAVAGKPRTHDLLYNGVVESVHFAYGQPTVLPFEKALKFQKEGFIVQDPDGRVLSVATTAEGALAGQLQPNETIARLDELTRPALLLRAMSKPGGEMFTRETHRETLVMFLMNTGVPVSQMVSPADLVLVDTEMEDAELDNMFPREEDETLQALEASQRNLNQLAEQHPQSFAAAAVVNAPTVAAVIPVGTTASYNPPNPPATPARPAGAKAAAVPARTKR